MSEGTILYCPGLKPGETKKVDIDGGQCIQIGSEPRTVPDRFVRAALMAGCLQPGAEKVMEAKPESKPTKLGQGPEEICADAIRKLLETGSDNDWTGSGMPKAAALKKLTSISFDASTISKAWKIVDAEVKAATTEADSQGSADADDTETDES